jgi:hypothetical protein
MKLSLKKLVSKKKNRLSNNEAINKTKIKNKKDKKPETCLFKQNKKTSLEQKAKKNFNFSLIPFPIMNKIKTTKPNRKKNSKLNAKKKKLSIKID